MKAKTKKTLERVAVWAIILAFILGSVAVYLLGTLGTTETPAYTPPPLNTLPEAQQQQPPAAGTGQPVP